MSLIDRNDAYKVLSDYYHHSTDVQHKALKEALDRVPENDPDIVRVVRCKDCDRSLVDFDRTGNPVYRCILFDPVVLSVEDDGSGFCSNGRRKE